MIDIKNGIYFAFLTVFFPLITIAQSDNVALNKQIKVSSVDGKNVASNAVDGIKGLNN